VQAGNALAHGKYLECVVAGNDTPATCGSEHVDELVAPGAWVDRHERDPKQRTCDHQVDELDMIGEQRAYTVSWLEAKLAQAGGETAALVPQLGIGARLVCPDARSFNGQDLEIRSLDRPLADNAGQRQWIVGRHVNLPGSGS
jgi:hypothetical protein